MNLWKIFSIFFEGKDLIDEMACTQYFHKHPINRKLHFFAFILLSCVLQILLNYHFGVTYCYIFCGLVGFTYSTFSLYAGLGYIPSLLITLLYIDFLTNNAPIWVYYLVVGLTLIMQTLGHTTYEGSLPAFRFFEFFVTAPVVVMIVTLNRSLGIEGKLVKEIIEKSSDWKDSSLEHKVR